MRNNPKKDLKNIFTRSSVADSVTGWLKSETDIVIDVTQKAIQENRFEVVKSALEDTTGIAREYIQSRIEYHSDQDIFINYLLEKLIDMKNMSRKDTHPEIMLSIATTARDIAIVTLDIKPIRSFAGENYLPLGFINLLKGICLSGEILKETSYAPMVTISYLVDIARVAIDRGFPRTANLISEALGEISRMTTKLHSSYTDIVSARANWGLGGLLDYMFINQDKIMVNRDYAYREVIDEINKSVETYLKDEERYQYTLRSNIKTFFGPLPTEQHGIAAVFIRSLQIKRKDEREYHYPLKALDEFLIGFNQNIMLGMKQRKYSDVQEMLEHLYMIGIALIGSMKKIKDDSTKSEALKVFKEHFLYPFINAISMSFKHDDKYNIPYDDYDDMFFSLIGILFYENDKKQFSTMLEDWMSKIIEIIQRHKGNIPVTHEGKKFLKYEIVHPLADLYRYLRLAGMWLNHYLPESNLLLSVVEEIKSQPAETIPQDNLYVGIVANRYPNSYFGEAWALRIPHIPYNSQYFQKANKSLYDQRGIDKFEKKIQENNNKEQA